MLTWDPPLIVCEVLGYLAFLGFGVTTAVAGMNVCDFCLTLYFVTCEKNSEDQLGRKDDGGTDVGPSLEVSTVSVFLWAASPVCVCMHGVE